MKYGNRKMELDGHLFDSQKEARRYQELRYMLRVGLIKDLKLQEPFELIPAQKRNGRVIERVCKYIADFAYYEKQWDGSWKYVVEDAKGFRTDVFKIKKKLMLQKYNIEIREV